MSRFEPPPLLPVTRSFFFLNHLFTHSLSYKVSAQKQAMMSNARTY